jgi:hypothetical protein
LISCIQNADSSALSDIEKLDITNVVLRLPMSVEWVGEEGRYVVTGPGLRYGNTGVLIWSPGTWEFSDTWPGPDISLALMAQDSKAKSFIGYLEEKGVSCEA